MSFFGSCHVHEPPYRRQRRSGQDVFRTPPRLSLMKHPHGFTTFDLLVHGWKRSEKDGSTPRNARHYWDFPVCRYYTVRARRRLGHGVPDKYAMERTGHATRGMLKMVYQHTMRTRQDAVSDAVDSCFSPKLHTVLPTRLTGA